MLDQILKYLPLLVFIAPFLAWLDKAKRFSHRRKFYVERLEAAQTYIDKYHNKPLSDFEKDCAAQALVGSEKIDHKKVDYLIENYPKQFFLMAGKLASTYYLIDSKEENSKIILTAKSSKSRWRKLRVLLAAIYCSSLFIFYSNEFAVGLLNQSKFLQPIIVGDLIYLIGIVVTLMLGIIVASISGLLFWAVDTAIEIYDELNIQHRP